jgi:hypothetical protein
MDRRSASRRVVGVDEPLCRARLRTGGQLLVLDACAWGVLAETTERLLPGRHLDVHIVSVQGRVLVRSRVARAFVARLDADAVHYRAALAFDRAIDVRGDGYLMPVTMLPSAATAGIDYPEPVIRGDIEFAERASAE